MGFILTAKTDAREFVFEDGGEARIGRTDSNDIVVHDNEASRNHARVFETEEGCFVEDLGSANGTLLNGEELEEASFLSSGDVIGIGGEELVFWSQAAEATGQAVPAEEEPEDESTVIKPAEALAAERQAKLAVVSRTSKLPAPQSRKLPARRSADLAPAKRSPRQPGSGLQKSAAEQARIKRQMQKSFAGRLRYAFSTLPPPKRRIVLGGIAAASLVILLGVFFLLQTDGSGGASGNEPRRLVVGAQPLWGDSFGWGEGVKWPNLAEKQFEFHPVAPGKMLAVIRYYAQDISAEEVDIQFNHVRLGFIPADTVDSREHELVVSPKHLRNNETNTLLFDNVRNPPGKESWRIWGIAVEIEPVPDFSGMEEARAAIASNMQAGQRAYEARNIAPANRYEAWRAFRKAWLIAESMEIKGSAEYTFIWDKYRELRREMDDLCAKYILEVRRAISADLDVIQVLEEILKYFPKPDHMCHREASEALGRP